MTIWNATFVSHQRGLDFLIQTITHSVQILSRPNHRFFFIQNKKLSSFILMIYHGLVLSFTLISNDSSKRFFNCNNSWLWNFDSHLAVEYLPQILLCPRCKLRRLRWISDRLLVFLTLLIFLIVFHIRYVWPKKSDTNRKKNKLITCFDSNSIRLYHMMSIKKRMNYFHCGSSFLFSFGAFFTVIAPFGFPSLRSTSASFFWWHFDDK